MNFQHRIICKQPGRYIGWPGVAKTEDGSLLVAFSGDRDAHVCPYGKMFYTRSDDNGMSWSEPKVIVNTPLDDRDPALLVCSDGTLIANWFTLYVDEDIASRHAQSDEMLEEWARHVQKIPDAERDYWSRPGIIERKNGLRGHWTIRSVDGGTTWLEPQRVVPSSTNPAIELADGRILYMGNGSMERIRGGGFISVTVSHDSGATWEEISRLNMFTGFAAEHGGGVSYLGEPHVVETGPGKLLAVARHEVSEQPGTHDNSHIWSFFSEDGGHTWTDPVPTPVVGKPPHLTRLSDGRILMSYGYRLPAYGQRACLSEDGGESWNLSHEIIIRDDGLNDDLGYPQSVECNDGSIVTVYYQIDKPGEKPSLMMTQWDVP